MLIYHIDGKHEYLCEDGWPFSNIEDHLPLIAHQGIVWEKSVAVYLHTNSGNIPLCGTVKGY